MSFSLELNKKLRKKEFIDENIQKRKILYIAQDLIVSI